MEPAIRTTEQLLRAQDVGRCELVRGEFRTLIPPGYEHGRVVMNLAVPLGDFIRAHSLGTILAAETGFVLARDPDTVRAPDIAYLAADREPGPARGYYEGAPDLVVEVLSPDDRPGYVREKVAEWLEAGAREVWVVDPIERTVRVHGASEATLAEHDELRTNVVPGFAVSVRAIFD